MAEHLASIFGTEKDKVNCPFYFKIGACRHGDRCSRIHNRPPISQTLLLTNMYQPPAVMPVTAGTDPSQQQAAPPDEKALQEHFEDFYEDVYEELSQYGEIKELNVLDNLAEHLVGNVYVKFRTEEQAERAMKALQGRFYAGKPILVEYSPVTDFREATCRQFELGECTRGGYCNFMHMKVVPHHLEKKLFGKRRHRSRSRSPHDRHRHRSRSPHSRKRRSARSPERHEDYKRRRYDDDRDSHRDRHYREHHHHHHHHRDRHDDRGRDRAPDGVPLGPYPPPSASSASSQAPSAGSGSVYEPYEPQPVGLKPGGTSAAEYYIPQPPSAGPVPGWNQMPQPYVPQPPGGGGYYQ